MIFGWGNVIFGCANANSGCGEGKSYVIERKFCLVERNSYRLEPRFWVAVASFCVAPAILPAGKGRRRRDAIERVRQLAPDISQT